MPHLHALPYDGPILTGGPISETGPQPGARSWVAPGLVDLQVNGFAGVDFQSPDLTVEDLVRATRALEQTGCTGFLLTLVTDTWSRLTAKLRHLTGLRAANPELRRRILGWHVEGPFLSDQPGFHGAHAPECMLDPSIDHIRELREITGNDPLLLTIAPERHGAPRAIAFAREHGIAISLGHTNATAAQLRDAVAAGAQAFTHLGNACPQQLDRHDNILWRVLDLPDITVMLIPDSIHVSPALFRLIHRCLPTERIRYVTDAMAAAGAPPGRYPLGALVLEVGTDGIVRYPGRSNFAGSALTPIQGVERAAMMLGCHYPEAWGRFAAFPGLTLPEPDPVRVDERPGP